MPDIINRQRVRDTFAAYTALYNDKDPKIILKINHTYRVAEICDEIAESLSFSPFDRDIAWLLGMLHDVGRFEQVKRYGTFSDADSVNHAHLGIDILFNEGKIWNYIDKDFPSDALALVRQAIYVHSDYRIPENLTEREQNFCNLLRDADKVDIFRVHVETPVQHIYNVSEEDLRKSTVSPAVKQAALEGHTVLRSLRETPADIMVGHTSLAFELVFPKSREIAQNQGFLKKTLEFETENEDTRLFLQKLKNRIFL